MSRHSLLDYPSRVGAIGPDRRCSHTPNLMKGMQAGLELYCGTRTNNLNSGLEVGSCSLSGLLLFTCGTNIQLSMCTRSNLSVDERL